MTMQQQGVEAGVVRAMLDARVPYLKGRHPDRLSRRFL
jgi:hypothetical protein